MVNMEARLSASVVIVCEKYFDEVKLTLDSLASQTDKAFEVLCVDVSGNDKIKCFLQEQSLRNTAMDVVFLGAEKSCAEAIRVAADFVSSDTILILREGVVLGSDVVSNICSERCNSASQYDFVIHDAGETWVSDDGCFSRIVPSLVLSDRVLFNKVELLERLNGDIVIEGTVWSKSFLEHVVHQRSETCSTYLDIWLQGAIASSQMKQGASIDLSRNNKLGVGFLEVDKYIKQFESACKVLSDLGEGALPLRRVVLAWAFRMTASFERTVRPEAMERANNCVREQYDRLFSPLDCDLSSRVADAELSARLFSPQECGGNGYWSFFDALVRKNCELHALRLEKLKMASKVDCLERDECRLRKKLENADAQIRKLRNSKSFRIGKKITAVPRKLKKLFG